MDKRDPVLISLSVIGISLLGSTILFAILWRVTVEDRNSAWELYYNEIGVDPSNQSLIDV